MTCTHTQNLLHAYRDGELDLVRHLEIEHHLADCPACAELLAGLESLAGAVRAGAPYHRAPDGLRQRLRAAVAREARPVRAWRRLPWKWLEAAAAAACIALVAWGLGRYGAGVGVSPAADERLAQEVFASHVRSLMAEHLTDKPSSDRHQVKPWFDGKLDFAPAVPDLSDHGFALVGGRLDYLDGRPVAALVYKRRLHVINCFVWPAQQQGEAQPQTLARQGYRAVRWARGGMTYWAVSDLNGPELHEFADLMRELGT